MTVSRRSHRFNGRFALAPSALFAVALIASGACGTGVHDAAPGDGGQAGPSSAAGNSSGASQGAVSSSGTSSAASLSAASSSRASSGAGGSSGTSTSDAGAGGADGSAPSVVDSGVCDACAPGALYVAPNGNDANPGTLAQPLQTLDRARQIVQARTSTMTSDLYVYLRGGTYPVTSTVTFSNADSGQNGNFVRYVAYPGERPLITGGQPITGWQAGTNGVYSATGVTSSFRQLYVNGVKAIRARTPNLGPNGAPNFYRLSGYSDTAYNVTMSASYAAQWNNLTKVEMHVMLAWADNVLRIAGITTNGGTATVTFQSPESPLVFVRPNPGFAQVGWGQGRAFYLENAREMLDQPGEWYLDETAHVLYYMPRSGEDMSTATVVAPMLETLVAVSGAGPDDQAGYLWFEGLTFAHSTYLLPSQQGFLDGQAGQYNLTATASNLQTVARPAAGVTVTNANHVHFEQNMFTQMAATGLDFISGTANDMIVGNVFTDIGGSGISIGKFTANDTTEMHVPYDPADPNEICTSDTIQNNYITNVTTEIQGACGIAAGYPRYVDIEHNEVSYVNYTGISVGFGWTSCPNAMSNNKIDSNNIHHVTQILADGASIYTLSNQGPASEVNDNYVHDYGTSTWADYGVNGLYFDEGSTGFTVANNVMENCPTNIPQNGQDTLDTCKQEKPLTEVNNNGTSSSIISDAGIEPAYANIKNFTIPVPSF